MGIGRREERLLGGVRLPLLRHLPGLKCFGLLVEFGDTALIHHGDPEIAGLVGLQVERADRITRFDDRQGIFGGAAALGVELSQELLAERREPDHTSESTMAPCGWISFPAKSYSVTTT